MNKALKQEGQTRAVSDNGKKVQIFLKHFNVRQPALNHKICLANRAFSSKGYGRLQSCELSICGAIFLSNFVLMFQRYLT